MIGKAEYMKFVETKKKELENEIFDEVVYDKTYKIVFEKYMNSEECELKKHIADKIKEYGGDAEKFLNEDQYWNYESFTKTRIDIDRYSEEINGFNKDYHIYGYFTDILNDTEDDVENIGFKDNMTFKNVSRICNSSLVDNYESMYFSDRDIVIGLIEELSNNKGLLDDDITELILNSEIDVNKEFSYGGDLESLYAYVDYLADNPEFNIY